MKTYILIALLSCFTIMLNACAPAEPTTFGIPQSQWNQLTPDQQQQVIQGYNQRQEIEIANRPLEKAIDSADYIIRREQSIKHNNEILHQNYPSPTPPSNLRPPMPKPLFPNLK